MLCKADLGIAHQILVMHDAMRHRFQRPADLLVDQLIAEDVLEEAAMLAHHRVDLPLRLAHEMHRIDFEILEPHQIREAAGELRGIDHEALARDFGHGLEHHSIRGARAVKLAIVEHVEVDERLAGGLARAPVDGGPEPGTPIATAHRRSTAHGFPSARP